MNDHHLFIGDSLIAYQDWQAVFPALNCLNLGVPGQTIGELVATLPTIMEQNPTANGIVVMIGTNNLVMGDFTLLTGYEELLTSLKQFYPQARMMITSLLPLQLSWLAADTSSRLNEGLASMASQAGADYVDLHDPFVAQVEKELFLEDGVHLSTAGYEVWVKVLAEMLG